MSILPQHQSKSDSWRTPLWLVEAAREVLGTIDLDPASDADANERVRAQQFIGLPDDSLFCKWAPGSVFLNPPGGRRGSKSLAGLFWQRLMAHRREEKLSHAIFVGFTLEILRTTQGKLPGRQSAADFPFCIPAKRVHFDPPPGCEETSPTHGNAIIYVPGSVDKSDKFAEVFSAFGKVVGV